MDHGQHFIFCSLGHFDLNSHFKNLNISSTSLTLGEPHKPEHTLSTLSSLNVRNLGFSASLELYNSFDTLFVCFHGLMNNLCRY